MTSPPQTIGPYRIAETLGRGGMGLVYRAEHMVTGEAVALKTVRVANEEMLSSFRREVLALARIRHPGVVRIVADGVERGLPWYAMQLLEGVTLRAYMPATTRRAGTGRPRTTAGLAAPDTGSGSPPSAAPASGEPPAHLSPAALADALSVLRRLCVTLAYLHGEGIVHRDLKPDNIFVKRSGMPVLVDFGLAARFAAREALETRGETIGTPAYASPEQVMGELVDARADLYALGCILYQLVTGRTPFVASTTVQLVLAQVGDEVVPPSTFVAGVPPALEALIMRLLAKSPGDRIGHADDVAAILGTLGAEVDLDAPAPPARAYLYRPGLAGRDAVMRDLGERLARLEARRGGILFVGGESGVGKTRLGLEAAREAQAIGVRVLAGECLAPSTLEAGGAPLHPFRRAFASIADRCREWGRRETDDLLGARGKVLAMYEPALAGLPGQEKYPEPAELPASAARHRLFTYVAETLAAFAERDPVLLVLDDLHWADEMTLQLLGFLLRGGQLEDEPMLVLATYRTEEAGEGLAELLRSHNAARVDLKRLSEAAVASIVGDMLALAPAPATLSRYLAEQSEGNPFFVAEYLRAAVEEGLLWRDGEGRWHVASATERTAERADYEGLALPRSLRELVERRLHSLPGSALAVSFAAAVVGREAGVALLSRMTSLDEVSLMEALAELLRRHVLEETTPGRVRFAHDKIRVAAYATLGEAARRALHRAAAEGIERLADGSDGQTQTALGNHWEQAGERAKARRCYLAAARAAAARHALAEAERLYDAYLRLAGAPTAESIAARNEFAANILRIQGRATEVQRLYRESIHEARAIADEGLEARSHLHLAAALRETGQADEGREIEERMLAAARESGDKGLEGQALADLAVTYAEQGRPARAREAYEQALEIHRELGNRALEAKNLVNYAALLDEHGDSEMARSLYEQALTIHRETGSRRGEGFAHTNLAVLFQNQERPGESLLHADQALTIAREVGDRRLEGIILGNLGGLYALIGRSDEARLTFASARAIHREVGNIRHEAGVLREEAIFERRSGAAERALDLIRESNRILREIGDTFYVAAALVEEGHALLALGRPARPALEEARELARSISTGSESRLDAVVSKLERAVAAAESGRRLRFGELPDDLPPGLRET